jgi:hypothetical protein
MHGALEALIKSLHAVPSGKRLQWHCARCCRGGQGRGVGELETHLRSSAREIGDGLFGLFDCLFCSCLHNDVSNYLPLHTYVMVAHY